MKVPLTNISRALFLPLCLPLPAQSQSFINEEIVHPLQSVISADLFQQSTSSGDEDGTSVHIVGVADSITSIFFCDTYGVHMPYYVKRDENSFVNSVVLPDTGSYHSGPFVGDFHRFSYDASVASNDSVFIVWSRQKVNASDVPPSFEFSPRTRTVLLTGTQVETIFDLQAAKNPRVAVSGDGYAHWVWESIHSVDPDTNYLIYTSSLQYRYRTPSGELSDPLEIDSGFAPQILTDQSNNIHLLWLKARDSGSQYFSIRYTRGNAGSFSTPVTLRDSLKAYYSGPYFPELPRVSFSVDSAGDVLVGWAEARAYPNSRFFLLSWDHTTVTIDSSNLYLSQIPRFAFRSNGEVHALWGVDSLSYSSNIHGPLFSEVRVLHSAMNVSHRVDLVLTSDGIPKGIYQDWVSSSINYVGDLANSPDSVFEGPSPGYLLAYQHYGSRPALVDGANRTWVIYSRDLYGSAPWLARFSDGPTRVRPSEIIPQNIALYQNHPNPFNPTTSISFSLPRSSDVSLKVFNLLGEEVATLVSGEMDSGIHTLNWDATGQSSGVYFYRLQAGAFAETRKLVLLR